MFKYEITFIVPEAETNEPVSKIIEPAGGKIIASKDLGIKAFTYPIAKAKIGRYFSVLFEIEPVDLKKLEKPLKLDRSIMRYLLVKALRVRAPRPPREVTGVKQKAISEKVEKKVVEEPKTEKIEVKKTTEEKEIEPKIEKKPAARKISKTIEKAERVAPRAREKAKETVRKETPKVPEIEKDLLDEKLKDLVSE